MSPDASWTFSPGAAVVMLAATGWYVWRWRAVREDALRLMLFLAGIATVAVALLGPVDRLGEQLFAIHMVQHLLLLDIASILVILGLTRRILRPVTRRMLPVERSAGILATPAFAITLYVATMWVWHIPALYDAALEHAVVHVLEHVSFAVAGGLYWWHLFSPIRSRHRLLGLGTAGYMVSTKILVGLLGVFLTFSPDSFYASYEDRPRFWGLSPGEDQAVGGAIMALEQMIVMGAAFAWLFVRMLSESEREERRSERYPRRAEETAPRVWAPIGDGDGRPPLTMPKSRADLQRQGVALRDGLPLTVWDEQHDGVAAVARYDPGWGGYVAELSLSPTFDHET